MDSDYILIIVICANYSRDFYGNTLLCIRKNETYTTRTTSRTPTQTRGGGCSDICALHGLVDIDLPSGDCNPDICSIQGELVCDE